MSLRGKVEYVKKIESITSNLDFCEIMIDCDIVHIFGDFNQLIDFNQKEVTYDLRQDVYKGKACTIIANIAEVYKIQTLDKTKDIRLIPKDAQYRPSCNFDSAAIDKGETQKLCTAFMSSVKKGSSMLAEWVDCTMIDCKSRMFNLRVFNRGMVADGGDVYEALEEMIGKFVKFDVTNTKFGLQATGDIEICDIPLLVPPEVDVATQIIEDAVAEDTELQEYMRQYNYIQHLRNTVDGELGYHLVHIASEISMINSIENISNLYDRKLMIRAAITSRGYLLPAKTRFSRPILNVFKILKSSLAKDRELLLILDPAAEEESFPTRNMYMKLASFTSKVVNERRGINEEINEVIDLSNLRYFSGGLF